MGETDNLILEHLRHIRSKVDLLAEETRDIKYRITSLEHQVASVHTDMALVHSRIDRVDDRLSRLEGRLQLRENTDS